MVRTRSVAADQQHVRRARGDLEDRVPERRVARRARSLEPGRRHAGDAQRRGDLRTEVELPLAGLADDVADVHALHLPRADPRVREGVEPGLREQLRAGPLVLAELRHPDADHRDSSHGLDCIRRCAAPEGCVGCAHGGATVERRPFDPAAPRADGLGADRARHRGVWPLRHLSRPSGPEARRCRADRVREPRPGARGGVPPAIRRVRGVRLLRGRRRRPARRRAHRLHAPPSARGARPPGRRARQGDPAREAHRENACPRPTPSSRRRASAGVVLMVAENAHFVPGFVAARAYVRAGAIGELRQIVVSARGYRRPAGWRTPARGDGRRAPDRRRNPLPAPPARLGRPGGRRRRAGAREDVPRRRGRGHRVRDAPVPERRRRGAGQLHRGAAAAPLAVGLAHRHRGVARAWIIAAGPSGCGGDPAPGRVRSCETGAAWWPS